MGNQYQCGSPGMRRQDQVPGGWPKATRLLAMPILTFRCRADQAQRIHQSLCNRNGLVDPLRLIHPTRPLSISNE